MKPNLKKKDQIRQSKDCSLHASDAYPGERRWDYMVLLRNHLTLNVLSIVRYHVAIAGANCNERICRE